MPRDGHGQASTGWGFLAAGLGLGIFRAPSQCALSDLGFSSARNNFHPLQFPRGLVRKGKKCCQRFSPSLPKCKPLGSPAGIWQPQECVGIQETSGQGLGVCVVKRNISLRTSLRHAHPQVSEQNCPCRPPISGFLPGACPCSQQPGTRVCSASLARDERSTAVFADILPFRA